LRRHNAGYYSEVALDAENLRYRLLSEGKPLPWWHPLVSGDPETVHQAGISVRGRVISERRAGDLEDHIVDWPDEDID